MKSYIPLLLLLLSCNASQEKPVDESQANIASSKEKQDICWTGQINNRIPVLLHYQVVDDILSGQIVYLNTRLKKPIRLIGTIEEDKSYRLLEFDDSGNITGIIIIAKPEEQRLSGIWFSPLTRKEWQLSLSPKDTVIHSADMNATTGNIPGNYHYQYGDVGYTGDFKLNRISAGWVAFSIFSNAGKDHAFNTADIETDTVPMPDAATGFTYKVVNGDSCEVQMTFYKDFMRVKYLKGDCDSQFGVAATIEGIFLKEK